MTHPAIWPHVSDDFSGEPEAWEPPLDDRMYVLALDGSEVLGLWMFELCSPVCYRVHTALLPHAKGEKAHQAAKEMALWIWEHTKCERIVTDVPEDNRLAFRFAQAAGMKEYGRNPQCFQKGGQLKDLIMLGMSRPGPQMVREVQRLEALCPSQPLLG